MATKTYRFAFAFAVMTVHAALAQRGPSPANIQEVLDPQFQNSSLLYAKAAPNDNPFLINEFLPVDIAMKNEKTLKNVKVKYDIERQILFAEDHGRYVILSTNLIKSFDMKLPDASEVSRFINMIDDGKEFFYEVVADGDIKLLKKTTKVRQRKTEVNSTGYNDEGARPSAYRTNESYYLLKADGLHQVRLTNKSILKTIGSDRYNECAKNYDLKLSQINDIKILLRDCK